MKLGVVGSRSFNNYDLLKEKLDFLNRSHNITHIVSGGAAGADSFAERWAKENHKLCIVLKPDWDKFGKSAGFKRNVQIVENSDAIIAFWDGVSKGTKHTIDITRNEGKPLAIVRYENVPDDKEIQ